MADRDSVISHLQIINTWASFARERDLQLFTEKHLESIEQWVNEAIALLKEQEEQLSIKTENFNRLVAKVEVMPKIVRCKDCIHRGKSEKCVLAAISEEKDYPLFMLDNRGEWFCADGEGR